MGGGIYIEKVGECHGWDNVCNQASSRSRCVIAFQFSVYQVLFVALLWKVEGEFVVGQNDKMKRMDSDIDSD